MASRPAAAHGESRQRSQPVEAIGAPPRQQQHRGEEQHEPVDTYSIAALISASMPKAASGDEGPSPGGAVSQRGSPMPAMPAPVRRPTGTSENKVSIPKAAHAGIEEEVPATAAPRQARRPDRAERRHRAANARTAVRNHAMFCRFSIGRAHRSDTPRAARRPCDYVVCRASCAAITARVTVRGTSRVDAAPARRSTSHRGARSSRPSAALPAGRCCTAAPVIWLHQNTHSARAPNSARYPRDRRECRSVIAESTVVGREQLRRLVLPVELVLHARAPECAHARAPRRVVEQLDDLLRQVDAIVASRVERGSCAEKRPSVRSNCTIGLPSAMYSMILFMVDLSFISLATSGIHADIGGVEHRQQLGVGHAAGEGHVVGDAELRARAPASPRARCRRPRGRTGRRRGPGRARCAHGLQQQVDALLLAHHADVADEIAPPALQRSDAAARRFRRSRLGPLRTTNTLSGSMPPRSMAMRRYDSLVAIDTSAVRKVQRSSAHHQPVEEVAPAELRFVQLGVDVVVVEDELLAEQLEEAADEEDQCPAGCRRGSRRSRASNEHAPAPARTAPAERQRVFERDSRARRRPRPAAGGGRCAMPSITS